MPFWICDHGMNIMNAAKEAEMPHKPLETAFVPLGHESRFHHAIHFRGEQQRTRALKRIPVDKCYEFWEGEVKRHLLNPHGKVDRSKLPDEYGYLCF